MQVLSHELSHTIFGHGLEGVQMKAMLTACESPLRFGYVPLL
eukprot:COSAG02_NODE_3314_length_6953_cov_4.605924_11_plen_42_part_00